MKNVVIAAGYATRLGELTRNFPKPLLPIGQSTILELRVVINVLKSVKSAGAAFLME